MRYRLDFIRQRPYDRGGPSSKHHSQEILRVLAKRYSINQKIVAIWKKRTPIKDLPTGPRETHSTVPNVGRGDHRRFPQAYAVASG
jgi:hypothetical protein